RSSACPHMWYRASARKPLLRAATSSKPNRSSSSFWSPPFGASLRTEIIPHCAGQDGAPPGKRTVNTEPLPCSLFTVTSPPIMRASLRVMAKPRPVPPYSCGRGIGLGEFLEQLGLLLGCHADAGIGHRDLDPVAAVDHPFDAQLDFALLGELAGIAQQIEQDLSQPHGIDRQAAKILRAFNHEAILILLRQRPRGADDVLKQGCQFPRFRAELQLAGFYLGEVEHLIDEAEKMSPRTVNPPQRLRRLFRAEARRIADHHLGQPDDG